ncbi:uncharacterized protein NPIL_323531 [Nephila pilipes]|uniref:Ionotropic glutamate receptor L-glutamate and glycine-binding domain-containing protein n=1 Tax=Nephila pilipes TaxID=299642 RepID=A0A8X6N0D7_NEPPI|nr:uncharacterized protein NPIL_323531 [Nephila pilipes]
MNHSQRIAVVVVPVRNVLEVNRSEDGEIKFHYLEGLFFQEVLKALGLQYDIMFPENNAYGDELPNGTWSGLIGMLQKEAADLAFPYISITEERSKVVGFSKTYSYSELTFVSHIPEDVRPLFAFLYPFGLVMWVCLLVTLISMSFLFSKFQRGKFSTDVAFFKLFPSILLQPLSISNNSLKSDILELFWNFFAMVISFSYSATLLSFLIQPSKPNYIRTFSELSSAVQRGTHKAVFDKFSNVFFLNSGIDHLVRLGEIILQNRWFMEFSKVHSEAYINPHSCQGINRNIAKVLFADRDDVYISKQSIYVTPLAFAYSKRFCCVSKLNWILSNFASAGVYEKMLRLSAMKMSLKHLGKPRDSKVVLPLSFTHLFGAFIVFAGGLIISLISFLGEILRRKEHFNSTTKQTFSKKSLY